MDGDGELYQEAAPWRALHAKQLGGCSADRDGLVGLRGRRARVRGGAGSGGRSRVGRQILLGWCCDRPCLDAARPLEEVNDAVLVAGGTCSVPPLGGLSAGPACGQGLGIAVVPGGENAGRGGRAGCRGWRRRRGSTWRASSGRRRAARQGGDHAEDPDERWYFPDPPDPASCITTCRPRMAGDGNSSGRAGLPRSSSHLRWHQLSSLISFPFPGPLPPRDPGRFSGGGRSTSSGVRYPGCLQFDHAPGGVVHLRYRQPEPVPQAPEPFAAGPGDRLLQLPPVDEISRAGGGARRGCPTRCGQAAAWALMIWWGRIPVHCGLLGGLAGLCRAACLVSEADELSGAGIAASLTVAAGGGVHHA